MHVGGVTTSNAVVTFNGYDCIPQEANDTALSCMTTERNAGINAPSTTVFLEGRGYAIISERAEDTVFRRGQIDRKMGRGKYWLIASRRSKDETALNDSQGKQLIFIFHKSQMG